MRSAFERIPWEQRSLVYFPNIRARVRQITPVAKAMAAVTVDEAAIVTIRVQPAGTAHGECAVPPHPGFWHRTSAYEAVAGLLTADVEPAIVWMIGEYGTDQLAAMGSDNQLPPGLVYRATPPLCRTAEVILRVSTTRGIRFPEQQGFGHFDGVRLAVFDEGGEPVALYKEWLARAMGGQLRPFAAIGVALSDDVAPQGCVGWLSPYGEEDREHAIIARAGQSRTQTAEELAGLLGLPLETCPAGAEEVEKGEYLL